MMDTDAGLGPAPPGARPAAAASSAPVVAEDKAILASKVGSRHNTTPGKACSAQSWPLTHHLLVVCISYWGWG